MINIEKATLVFVMYAHILILFFHVLTNTWDKNWYIYIKMIVSYHYQQIFFSFFLSVDRLWNNLIKKMEGKKIYM